MTLPMTVVTFVDADDVEFPITLVGKYDTIEAAVADANGVLTKAIWEGRLNPRKPIAVNTDRPAYEWNTGQTP